MSAIARTAANLVTTSGVWLKGGVNNDSFDNVTTLPSSLADGITLISSQTASSSASISFTSGITSTYKAYKFVYVNIHGSIEDNSDGIEFQFNMSTDGGSNYNVTKTTTYFQSYHNEADTDTTLGYLSSYDLAQSTAFQDLFVSAGASDSDQSGSGSLILFNPSSTTYVKHFISCNNYYSFHDYSMNSFVSGYANTTSAVNAIQFKMSAGNIDAGTIYMYGIK